MVLVKSDCSIPYLTKGLMVLDMLEEDRITITPSHCECVLDTEICD